MAGGAFGMIEMEQVVFKRQVCEQLYAEKFKNLKEMDMFLYTSKPPRLWKHRPSKQAEKN